MGTNQFFSGFCVLPFYETTNSESNDNIDASRNTVDNRVRKLEKLLKLDQSNKEEKKLIVQICKKYNDLFHIEGDILTHTNDVKHTIVTKADKTPVYLQPFRVPKSHYKEIRRQLKEMLNIGIIQASSSPWNSPLFLKPETTDNQEKKSWKVIVNYRRLNEITVKDAFPIPNILDIFDQLGTSKYFSTLNLASGFHQILMDEKDKEKTAFSTPFGHYEFNRMPVGLKNSSATCQRFMNDVLGELQGYNCFVYLDSIIVKGFNLSDHNKKLTSVLNRLREHNLKLQPDKCNLIKTELTYLGHTISKNGLKPIPSKVNAIANFVKPKNVKDVKSFLGLAGYYRRFVPEFAKISKPLTKLLNKSIKFKWDAFCDEAFLVLKEKLLYPPTLAFPDFDKEFLITTNPSDFAVGAVLSQGPVTIDRPIYYASRTLNIKEIKYSPNEKKLLAVVYAIEQFRPYVHGIKFTLLTDPKPLQWLMSLENLSSRLTRWKLILEDYDYEIIHIIDA